MSPRPSSNPGFVDLWVADSLEMGSIPRSAAELLDEGDRQELGRRGAPERRGFLLSRVMLRLALSRRTGRDPSSWRFLTTELGRPRLATESAEQGRFEFSVSHAGDWVAVALSNQLVGLDLELPGVDPESVACCLSVEERARLRDFPEPRRSREFLELWTAKEAYSKLLGQGTNRELSEITRDEISRAAFATTFSLLGGDQCLVTVLSARGGSTAAPLVQPHFLSPGSLSLVGAVSARTPWIPTPLRAARPGFPQSFVS